MIPASAFLGPAVGRGFDWFAGVPCSYLTPFIDAVIEDPALTYVASANEGDAVAACAGASLGGRRAVAMMQNSGLGNAVSPLTSLAWTFRLPMLLVVTWRGEPGGAPDEPQHELMGAITPTLLEAMQIPWEAFPSEADRVAPALDRADAWMRAERRPYAFVLQKGAVESSGPSMGKPPQPRSAAVEVQRRPAPERVSRGDVLRRVIARTPTDRCSLIATTGFTGRELYAIEDRPNQLYMVGSMGCASSIGLGLALARPDRKSVVLDGDGAALMRMGNLATLGSYGGANLVHLLLDNGVHDSTGAQATVSPAVDFAEIAKACGYAAVFSGEDSALVDDALEAAGPVLLHLRIRPGAPADLPRPKRRPDEVAARLIEHLGEAPRP